MAALADPGVNYIAPPMWMLVTVDNGRNGPVPWSPVVVGTTGPLRTLPGVTP